MRIISGKFKGKRIQAPGQLPVRPTTDFAKEALFNILNNQLYFDEISVLDLFSGIGSITFEFASRGTGQIVSVDQNHGCIKFQSETAKKLEIEENISFYTQDALKFISKPASRKFDLIFADPPYDLPIEQYDSIIENLFKNGWLTEDGIFILEHSSAYDFSKYPHFSIHKKYGNVHFSFFEIENIEE